MRRLDPAELLPEDEGWWKRGKDAKKRIRKRGSRKESFELLLKSRTLARLKLR